MSKIPRDNINIDFFIFIQLNNFITSAGYYEGGELNKQYFSLMKNENYLEELERFLMKSFKKLDEQTNIYLNES